MKPVKLTAVSLCSFGALVVLALHGCGVPEEATPAAAEETRSALTVNAWVFQGPSGFNANVGSTTILYSGEVTDIDKNFNNNRIATVAGGLFQWQGPGWIPIADSLTQTVSPPVSAGGLAMGAVQTHPTNSNIILAGTGSDAASNAGGLDVPPPTGSGLYRTTDGGATWTNVLTKIATGGDVFKIDWNQTNAVGTVHAATGNGYYRSTDSGQTWTQTLGGLIGDIAHLANDTTLYVTSSGVGVLRSLDGGLTWSVVLKSFDLGMRLAATSSGNVVFAFGETLASPGELFKSTDGGTTWSSVPVPTSIGIGLEDCVRHGAIATKNGVNVLLGCYNLYQSQQGGATWTQVNSLNVHSGINVLRFSTTTTAVVAGTSGGFESSPDNGSTWFSNANDVPVSEIDHFDVRFDSPTVYYASTYDNGAFSSLNGGASWHAFLNSALPASQIWSLVDPALGSTNAWQVDWLPNRWRTTDAGTTWTVMGNNLPATSTYVQIHHDQVPGVFLYTQAANSIYQSTDAGVTWNLFPSPTFPALPGTPTNFAVGRWSGNSAVYVNTGTKLIVLDPSFSTTTWRDVTSSFTPSFTQQMHFSVSNTDPNTAYGFSANKIWKTTDRGATWHESKGKLAAPPATFLDVLENPLNTAMLFVATNIGVYKSPDTGADWVHWNNGLPAGSPIAVELHGAVVGTTFQVVGGFFGRGIWQRDASGDDP
jgi:hypothetical protein